MGLPREGLSVCSQQVAPETEAWPGSQLAWYWLVLRKSEPRVLVMLSGTLAYKSPFTLTCTLPLTHALECSLNTQLQTSTSSCIRTFLQ